MKKYLNRISQIEKQLEPNKQEISDEELQEKSKYYAKEIRRYLHDDVPAEEIDLVHFEDNTKVIDEDEAIEFVRDTAIERRNITKEQRIDIILRSEELINELEEKAREKQMSGLKKGSSPLRTNGPTREKQNTDDTLGEMAGVSGTTFRRMKRVKRESPELYEDIVKGEKSIRKAHDELPSVKKVHFEDNTKVIDETMKRLTTDELRQITGV